MHDSTRLDLNTILGHCPKLKASLSWLKVIDPLFAEIVIISKEKIVSNLFMEAVK